MLRIYFLLTMLCASGLSLWAQKNTASGDQILEFKETSFEFGKIRQGKPVTHNFEVINRSNAPLIVENVEASRGCTTPEWSDAPIPAGGSSTIKVGFNASSEGMFKESITVHYNDGRVKTLLISGEVYPAPTTSAPLNPSLSLLKQ